MKVRELLKVGGDWVEDLRIPVNRGDVENVQTLLDKMARIRQTIGDLSQVDPRPSEPIPHNLYCCAENQCFDVEEQLRSIIQQQLDLEHPD